MLSTLFESIYTEFSITSYLICTAASLLLGLLLALVQAKRNRSSSGFMITLILLPAVVQTVLMLVNGNVGTGIAVAGAFGLVKYRSAPCKDEELAVIFVAVAIGLATSTGYIGIAAIFTAVVTLLLLGLDHINILSADHKRRQLRVTIPENLNYEEAFAEVFASFTSYHKLISVKTSNMGSLFRLTYDIDLLNPDNAQAMINELRVRNSNLDISISVRPEGGETV